jgi:hypothetical protein
VLGTPSSGTATNLTGTASGLTAGNVTTNANLTGDVTSVGNASTIAANAVTNAKMATMAAYTIKANATGSSAVPTDVSIPALTQKASPFSADMVMIVDSAASNALKYTTVSALASAGAVASLNGQTGALALIIPPQGRLTLTSGVAVTTSDVAGATSIYFTPTGGNQVPIYDGTNMVPTTFAELTLALDSTAAHTGYQQSGKNFDLFVVNDSGTIRLGTGPAWSSDTARGTGAGTTELDFSKSGIPTNKNTMTLRFGSASGNTVSVAANLATYVGSFRAVADGQATDSKALRLLFNAFNQVLRAIRVSDPTASWTYSTGSWRQVRASTANQIDILDGLGLVAVDVKCMAFANSSAATLRIVRSGIGLDGTTAIASGATGTAASVSSAAATTMYSFYAASPGIGKHSITWLEFGGGTDTQTWFGTDTGSGNFVSGLVGTIAL